MPHDHKKYMREWRKARPGYDAANIRRYRERNPEHYPEYEKKRWVRDREKLTEKRRLHQKQNPEIWAAYSRNRHAKKRGSLQQHTKEQILFLGGKQGWRCGYCATDITGDYHADHIVPLSKNGSNGIRNIQLLCPPCNIKKSDKDALVFARQLGLLL